MALLSLIWNQKRYLPLTFSFVFSALGLGNDLQASESYQYSKASNEFVSVGSISYAFRKIGKNSGTPLVLLMHTRGNMDSWDPALVDALAKQRVVVAFDNKGVGLTRGKAPDTFEEMSDDAAAFIRALGYRKVDILGFSIGGAVGQGLLVRHRDLIRKAILAGTSAKGGEGINSMSERSKAVSTSATLTDDDLLYSFFAPTDTSQALGRNYISRLKLRKSDKDIPVSMETAKAQAVAREKWGTPEAGYSEALHAVATPVLVANGKDDIRMPTVNSYKLFSVLPNAGLILYPDSGHGFLFQYPETCADHFNGFLNQQVKSEEPIRSE
jgi:pimeloyl-ACP methyl ester carboxylesterase